LRADLPDDDAPRLQLKVPNKQSLRLGRVLSKEPTE
jgi:hypothetical protein